METGSTCVYVVPRGGGGWELRDAPTGPSVARSATKQDALGRAVLVVEGNGGGRIVVLGPNGSVQRTLAVDAAPKRPWWYVRPGTQRWLLLVLISLQLALRVVAQPSGTLELFLTAGLVVLLVCTLVSVLRSRALDRSRRPTDVVEDR